MRPLLSLPGARPASEPGEKIDTGPVVQSKRRRGKHVEAEGRCGAEPTLAPGRAVAAGVLTDEEHDEVRRELGLDEASMRRALGVDDWKARRRREEGRR